MIRSTRLPVRLLLIVALWIGSSWAAADELSEVHRLHYSGQTAAAIQKADEFLAAKPKDASMRFLKGVMLADTQHAPEAIEVFQKLAEDYPDLPEPYNNLATLYAATGQYDKARAALDQALRANPGYATAHENLGDVYAMLASQSYARALKLDPGNTTVPPKLAMVRELFTRKVATGTVAPSHGVPVDALAGPVATAPATR